MKNLRKEASPKSGIISVKNNWLTSIKTLKILKKRVKYLALFSTITLLGPVLTQKLIF